MPEGSDFQQTALSESKVATPNPSNNTIPPAQIAQNTNLSDIFSFKFEANESPFLLSNTTINEQKAITVMYIEATVKEKPIRLILNSESTRSIITYQLIQQLQRTVDRPAQTVIVIADGMKKTPVGKIDNFPFIINGIIIPVKVLVMDTPQYQALKLKISYQGQYTIVPATCGTFNKQSEKAPVFEFEEEKEMPLTETYMALGSTSNWAEETKQEIFEKSRGWKKVRYCTLKPRKELPYILLNCKVYKKKLSSMRVCISPEKKYETRTCYFCKAYHRERFGSPKRSRKWDNTSCLTLCDQTCQYVLSISEKVKRGTLFDVAYNNALNKLYHYPHDAEMIFDLTMALINRATQEDICQMKEAEYIEYTMELARFNYEDKCSKCYALSIPLSNENDQEEIEFGKLETKKEITTTSIYLIENQSTIQLKYFDNNGQRIKPEKAHEIDAGYDLRYSGKDTLVLQPKLSLASKEINIRGEVIDAGYTRDITIMLQNETDKPFRIEHVEKIAQAIYLLLINISGLQSVNNREQLGKSERRTQGFGSTGQFAIPVNIALNTQNESHQILQLPQPIIILPFGEHHEIYTCSKPTTTQQIFESNKQIYENSQIVSNFIEIVRHTLLSNPNINPTTENYHLLEKKLSRINMSFLEPQQQRQLKQLITEFADIFAKDNNDLGKTDIVQHQIHTRDALPK
ncbi:hypothetical protein G9A89_010297 [Geosiphon pyriformis]|nr:hypothetical protein G9A89_010297 [Geosiphon pyriformis]